MIQAGSKGENGRLGWQSTAVSVSRIDIAPRMLLPVKGL
jgi:hypothetical protein